MRGDSRRQGSFGHDFHCPGPLGGWPLALSALGADRRSREAGVGYLVERVGIGMRGRCGPWQCDANCSCRTSCATGRPPTTWAGSSRCSVSRPRRSLSGRRCRCVQGFPGSREKSRPWWAGRWWVRRRVSSGAGSRQSRNISGMAGEGGRIRRGVLVEPVGELLDQFSRHVVSLPHQHPRPESAPPGTGKSSSCCPWPRMRRGSRCRAGADCRRRPDAIQHR